MKIIRPVIYVLIIGGAVWYFLQHRKQAAAREQFNAAVEHINARKYQEAIDALEAVPAREVGDDELLAKKETHLAMAHAGLGEALFKKKQYKEAVAHLERVPELSEAEADEKGVWLLLGKCYRELGSTSQAVAALKNAVRADNGNREAKLLLGRYENRLQALPLVNKAKVAFQEKNFKRARRYYEELATDADLVRTVAEELPYYYLAACHFELGDGEAAVRWAARSFAHEEHFDGMKARHETLRKRLQEQFPEAYATIDPEAKQKLFQGE